MPGTRPGRGRQWVIAGLWLGVLGLFGAVAATPRRFPPNGPGLLKGISCKMRSGAGDGSLPNGWPTV